MTLLATAAAWLASKAGMVVGPVIGIVGNGLVGAAKDRLKGKEKIIGTYRQADALLGQMIEQYPHHQKAQTSLRTLYQGRGTSLDDGHRQYVYAATLEVANEKIIITAREKVRDGLHLRAKRWF